MHSSRRQDRSVSWLALGFGLLACGLQLFLLAMRARLENIDFSPLFWRVFPWLAFAALIAVLFGFGALVAVRGTSPRWRGLAALCLGVLAYVAPMFCYPVPGASGPKAHCLTNVKNLALSLTMYAADYDSLPEPATWSDALRDYTPAQIFVDPVREKHRSGYAYNAGARQQDPHTLDQSADLILVFESDVGWNAAGGLSLLPTAPRHMGGDNFGFADGHAKWYHRPHEGHERNEGSLNDRPQRWYRDTVPGLIWDPAGTGTPPSGKLAPRP